MPDTPYDRPPDHMPPSDNTTMRDVLASYEASGFATQFTVEPGAAIRCAACSSVVAAADVAMHSMRRLEGASDPADMMAVVALSCPVCSSKGTAVLGYGPMASAEDSDVLVALRDRRNDDRLPPNAAPAEAGPADAHGR